MGRGWIGRGGEQVGGEDWEEVPCMHRVVPLRLCTPRGVAPDGTETAAGGGGQWEMIGRGEEWVGGDGQGGGPLGKYGDRWGQYRYYLYEDL